MIKLTLENGAIVEAPTGAALINTQVGLVRADSLVAEEHYVQCCDVPFCKIVLVEIL